MRSAIDRELSCCVAAHSCGGDLEPLTTDAVRQKARYIGPWTILGYVGPRSVPYQENLDPFKCRVSCIIPVGATLKCARLGVTEFARAEIFFDTHQKTGEHRGGTSQLPVQTVPCTETARKTKRGKRKQTPAKQSTGITPQDPPDEASAGPGHVPMEHRQRVFACPCDEGLCKRPSGTHQARQLGSRS